MTEPIFLGIDLGTSSVKVIVLGLDGTVRATAQEKYPMMRPHPTWAEQDPEAWWNATCDAVRSVLGAEHYDVRAVGLSGQMHGLVLVDGGGSLLRPAIVWSDARSVAQTDEWSRRIDPQTVEGIAGLPVATGMLGVSLTWVRDVEPDVYRAAANVMLPKDYLRYRLTGEIGTEPTDASGSLLYDVRRGGYSEKIADAVGLDLGKLPKLGTTLDIAGAVTPEASRATGFPEGTPVAFGGGDQAMAGLSLGLEDPARAAVAISSGGTVFKRTAQPLSASHGLHVLRAAPSDQWFAMGVVLAAGLSVDWLAGQILGSSRESAALSRLMEEAYSVQKGADGLIASTHLGGTRTPRVDPLVRGNLLGLGLHHSRAHILRAFVEGTSIALARSLEAMETAGEQTVEVVLSGGGARFPIWGEVLADITGMPVQISSDLEHSAIGAGLAAAAAVDTPVEFDPRARVSTVIEPDMDSHEMYGEIDERLSAIERAVNDLNRGDLEQRQVR